MNKTYYQSKIKRSSISRNVSSYKKRGKSRTNNQKYWPSNRTAERENVKGQAMEMMKVQMRAMMMMGTRLLVKIKHLMKTIVTVKDLTNIKVNVDSNRSLIISRMIIGRIKRIMNSGKEVIRLLKKRVMSFIRMVQIKLCRRNMNKHLSKLMNGH